MTRAERWTIRAGLAVFWLVTLLLPADLAQAQTPAGERAPVNGYITQFSPPPQYRAWYEQAERCTGKRGDFSRVEWFVVPAPWSSATGITYAEWRIKNRHGDLRMADPLRNAMEATVTHHHYIVVNAQDWRDSMLVMHEAIHDLLWYAGADSNAVHPLKYFNGVCARPNYP